MKIYMIHKNLLLLKDIKNKVKNRVWKLIEDFFYYQRVEGVPFVLNINYKPTTVQKKALICYQTTCYFKGLDSKTQKRTLPFEILSIINTFIESGYVIDLINCTEKKIPNPILDRKYNYIFGFGESHYIMTSLQPEATSILYMTENTPEFSYREEQKRLDYYFERHGRKLKIIRSGMFYKKYHLEKPYDYVITMGEPELLENKYSAPVSIFPTGLINPNFVFGFKNHEITRKNFLWLGSLGAIHKGLDLLLDVFKEKEDLILHICGLTENEKRLLKVPQVKNIINYGHILISSDLFVKLVEDCTFIILPSCSEGTSTSILTGMLHGLIPVVMKDAGFNKLSDNAIFLETYKIDYLISRITELSNRNPEELSLLSKKVYEFASRNFTINAFSDNIRNILKNTVGI